MPKFYVMSGGLKTVIDRNSSHQAAIDAFRNAVDNEKVDGLSQFVKVSELGFDNINSDDILFLTQVLLDDAGVGDEFFHEFPDEETL